MRKTKKISDVLECASSWRQMTFNPFVSLQHLALSHLTIFTCIAFSLQHDLSNAYMTTKLNQERFNFGI